MYTNKIIMNNKISNNLLNDKEDNISISSHNYGDRRKFLENNNQNEENKFGTTNISKLAHNDFNNTYKHNYPNRIVPIQNSNWEDSIHSKFKNLELTNDDLDEMFNVFTDNKKLNYNKK